MLLPLRLTLHFAIFHTVRVFARLAAVREEANRVEAFLFEKNIAFLFELPVVLPDESIIIRSDRTKVQSVISVLLENAVKYTPDGGRVTLTIDKANEPKRPKGSLYVSVANTGEYIPPEDLAHIFDRFFRTDRSRNSETGGHGIGLSIAKEIARSLGGELTAASVPRADGGAINTFKLYL